jgi:hypothetical protein
LQGFNVRLIRKPRRDELLDFDVNFLRNVDGRRIARFAVWFGRFSLSGRRSEWLALHGGLELHPDSFVSAGTALRRHRTAGSHHTVASRTAPDAPHIEINSQAGTFHSDALNLLSKRVVRRRILKLPRRISGSVRASHPGTENGQRAF